MPTPKLLVALTRTVRQIRSEAKHTTVHKITEHFPAFKLTTAKKIANLSNLLSSPQYGSLLYKLV